MYRIALVVIIIIGSLSRYKVLDKHFAHCDDLVVSSVLSSSNNGELLNRVNKRMKTDDNFIINSLKNNETLLHIVKDILGPIDKASFFGRVIHKVAVSPLFMMYTTSYAPIQFVFTSLLVSNDMDYMDTKFYSRLPSFLIYILTIVFLVLLFYRISPENFMYHSVVSCLILTISWEHIIFSVQSESYSIAILAVFISILLFDWIVKKNQRIASHKQIGFGLSISVLMFMNYQMIFFLPNLFLAFLLFHRRDVPGFFKKHWVSISISIFFWILTIGIVYSLGRGGVHWNAGPDMEYVFSISKSFDLLNNLKYVIIFFFSNFYIVFKFLVSTFHYSSYLNNLYALNLLIFFLFGVFSFLTSTNEVKRHISYYFFGVCFTWIVLIINQKLTLSPTRHSLIFLSFIILFSSEGILFFTHKIKRRVGDIKLPLLVIGTVLLSGHLYSFNGILLERLDPFEEEYIEGIMKEFDVTDLYSYSWTNNYNSMVYVKKNFSSEILGNVNHFKILSKNESAVQVIMLSSSRSPEYFNVSIIKEHLCEALNDPLPRFKSVYNLKKYSDEEVDFGNYTENGTNGLFIEIIEVLDSDDESLYPDHVILDCKNFLEILK